MGRGMSRHHSHYHHEMSPEERARYERELKRDEAVHKIKVGIIIASVVVIIGCIIGLIILL